MPWCSYRVSLSCFTLTAALMLGCTTGFGADDGWRVDGGLSGDAGGVVTFQGSRTAALAVVGLGGQPVELTIKNLDGPDENYRIKRAGSDNQLLMLVTWTPVKTARYRVTVSGAQLHHVLHSK